MDPVTHPSSLSSSPDARSCLASRHRAGACSGTDPLLFVLRTGTRPDRAMMFGRAAASDPEPGDQPPRTRPARTRGRASHVCAARDDRSSDWPSATGARGQRRAGRHLLDDCRLRRARSICAQHQGQPRVYGPNLVRPGCATGTNALAVRHSFPGARRRRARAPSPAWPWPAGYRLDGLLLRALTKLDRAEMFDCAHRPGATRLRVGADL